MAGAHDFTSVRYHLAYPRQATVFSWAECSCLARSLGYRDASIEVCYRQAVDARHQTDGFQLSQLDAFLGSKFFKSGFDFSYNSHSCEWNEQVVRRAFAVMAGRGMTFQELHTTRVAYGLYESSDLRGLKAKPGTVMRALKACGRAISLGKMAHRVRHMRFHEPGRLQLDEFIDLALWAGPLAREEAKSSLPRATSALPDPETRLHQLVSFEDLLTPLDGRIQRRLDAEYRREERQYVRELVRSTEPRLRQCSVRDYRDARLVRSRKARSAYEPLRRAVRAGGASSLSGRPTTADWSDWTDGQEEEVTGAVARETAATVSGTASRAQIPLVTQSDLARTELLRDALTFQSEALPEFHARWTADNMQTIRPGFQGRHEKRSAAAAANAESARRLAEAEGRAAEAANARRDRADLRLRRQRWFAELAKRQPTPSPLPSHGRVCEAANRGAAAAASQCRRYQRQQRSAKAKATIPTTTGSAKIREESSEEDESWFEPQLGLTLPLSSRGASSRPTVSRLGFASSCPPRVHPVTVAVSEGDEGQREISELIQRVVYA